MYEQTRARERDRGHDGFDFPRMVSPVPGKHTLPERHTLQIDHDAPEAAITSSAGHESRKIKLELGHGTVTGGLTLTFETGTTGIPLGDDHLKALKTSATLKLNEFAMKLETALLTGKLGTDLDGVKVSIEANVLKVSSDGAELSKKLMTIALKVDGDVSHWFMADRPVSVKLEGELQVALGGKLATKLTEFAVSELEEVSAAQEIETAGLEMAEHARVLKELETRRATTAAAKLAELEGKIVERRALIMGREEVIKDLTLRLAASRSRTTRVLYRLEGRLVKTIARAMEKRAAQLIARNLARIIPIVNVAMLALDAVEIIQLLRMLWRQYNSDGEGAGGDGDGKEPGGVDAHADEKHDGKRIETDVGDPAGKTTKGRSTDDVMQRLSVSARSVVREIDHKDRHGVALGPEHVQMIGMLVARLSPGEVDLLVTTLREHASGPQAKTPEEVIETIDSMARAIKNNSRIVTVDGKPRPELTPLDGPVLSPDKAPAEEPPAVKGPITSPSQVRTRNEVAAAQWPQEASRPTRIDLTTVVQEAPVSVLTRWFMFDGSGDLVMSGEGARWRAANIRKQLDARRRLTRMNVDITRGQRDWNVDVTFYVETGDREQPIAHHFMASPGSGNAVALEPYTLMVLP